MIIIINLLHPITSSFEENEDNETWQPSRSDSYRPIKADQLPWHGPVKSAYPLMVIDARLLPAEWFDNTDLWPSNASTEKPIVYTVAQRI